MAQIHQPLPSPPQGRKNTDAGEQAAPPNLPFRELVQKVREFLSIPDPAAEEHYKPGSALGRDPLLLLQEKAGRPPSIKLPMVSNLSRLQTAQDEAVKPSTSSTLDMGKFPAIPPIRVVGIMSWMRSIRRPHRLCPRPFQILPSRDIGVVLQPQCNRKNL